MCLLYSNVLYYCIEPIKHRCVVYQYREFNEVIIHKVVIIEPEPVVVTTPVINPIVESEPVKQTTELITTPEPMKTEPISKSVVQTTQNTPIEVKEETKVSV